MKAWPKKRARVVPYSSLIFPIKQYITSLYKVVKKTNPSRKEYDGFNFGKEELKVLPDMNKFLDPKMEEHFKKSNISPFDMALFAAFNLGLEQGRRRERQTTFSEQVLHKFLLKRTEDIKKLKKKIEELENKANRDTNS